MLQVACPNCGMTYKFRDQVIDRSCRCSNCALLFRVKDNLAPARIPEESAIEFVYPAPSQFESQPPSASTGSRTKVAIIVLSVIALVLSINRFMHQQADRDAPQVAAASSEGADDELRRKENASPVAPPPVEKSEEERSSEVLALIREMFDAIVEVQFTPASNNQLMELRRIDALKKGRDAFEDGTNQLVATSFRIVNCNVFVHKVELKDGVAHVEATLRSAIVRDKGALLQGIFVDEDHKCTEALTTLNVPGFARLSGTFSTQKGENEDRARQLGQYRLYFKLDEVR